jgi:PKD repeat protein
VTLTVADGQYSDSERLAVAVLGEDEPLPDEALGGGDTIAPMADLQTPVETVPVGESLRLSAAESVDPDGAILDYRWDFDGDGSVDQTTQEPTIRHAFEQSGSYDPTVTVVDSAGATATASTTVRVAAESAFPTASFDVGAVDGDELVAGAPVGFSAADSTAPDEIVSYEWEFGDGTTRRMTARRSSSPRPETTYSYDRPGEYTVTLTVTAENGLQRRTNRTIRVGAPATPEIGSVDAEKPGQMIRGIDLENSYTVPVSSQVDIESVVFEFPGGETREATRARALERRVERVTDRSDVTLWQLADVNVDTVTGPGVNTVEVRATDEQGQTGTTTFSVGAFDPPAWFATLMGDPTVTRDEGRWVLQSDSLAVPPDELPGPTFDLDVPVEEIAGQFEVGIGANYGFEYVFAQSRATANGGGVLSLSTPIPGLSTETDIGSVLGGPSTGPVTVSGTVRVTENAQRAVFERGRVAYGVETSGTVLLAGVGVPVPKTGGTVGVTVDLTLTTGIEPAVELAVNDARTSVGLSAIDLTQSLDVNVTAGAGGSVGLGGTRVGLEIRGIAGGGVEFTTEVLPELNTERVLVELRAGARACLGPCLTEWVLNDEYPLVTEEPAAPRLEVTLT